MKYYLIKLNAQEQRNKGYNWVLFEHVKSDYKDNPICINAKHISMYVPVYTKDLNGSFFMECFGNATNDDGEVIIDA